MHLWKPLATAVAVLTAALFLSACGSEVAPPLAAEGEPTLVYIYTEA